MRGRGTRAATPFRSSAARRRESHVHGTWYAPGPMKLVVATLLAALLLLQYRLWVSDEGMREVWHLRQAVENQAAENAVLVERNAQMRAEVADLKQGLTAVEERARNDLGMIAANETFYQVVDATHLAPDGERAEPASMQAQNTPQ